MAYRSDSVIYTPLTSIASVWNAHVGGMWGESHYSASSFTLQPIYEIVDDRDSLYEHYRAGRHTHRHFHADSSLLS